MKNIRKNLILFLLLLTTSLVFFACDSNKTYKPKYQYLNIERVVYYEPNNSIPIEFDAVKTDVDGTILIFDKSISDREKDEFTESCEQILDFLNIDKKLTYYIHSNLYTSVKDDTIYFKYVNEDFNKLDLTLYTLLGMTNESMNYGFLYGSAISINAEFGWLIAEHKTLEQTKEYIESNPSILDMEYPQFLTEFATNEEIVYTKSVAKYFIEYLEQEYGREQVFELCELRKNSLFNKTKTFYNETGNKQFGETVLSYKKAWLDYLESAVIYEYCPNFYYTLNTSRQYPFIIETNWVNHYFIKGFGNTYMPYELDYAGLKNYIEIAENDMQKVRDFFDCDKKELNKPSSMYVNDLGSAMPEGYYGYTTWTTNETFVLVVQGYVHEYIHAIAIQLYSYVSEDWLLEGLARYCEMEFSTLFYNKIVEQLLEFETYDNPEEFGLLWYRAYLEYASDEYNLFDWNDMYVFLCDIYYPDAYNEYRHGSSFVGYLIEQYGKENLITVYDDPSKIMAVYGKTEYQLKTEWMDYIRQKFNSFWQEYNQ